MTVSPVNAIFSGCQLLALSVTQAAREKVVIEKVHIILPYWFSGPGDGNW